MGHQIVKQPDGKLAVWSSVVDNWILFDATPDQLLDYYAEEAADEARRTTQRVLDAVLTGDPRRVYFQFTTTFDEAQELRAEIHGSAPWPPAERVTTVAECPTCGHPALVTTGFMHSAYEPVGCTDTAELRERLTKAAADLHALMLKAGNPNEQRRLKAKGEGVRLALSYLEDLARG